MMVEYQNKEEEIDLVESSERLSAINAEVIRRLAENEKISEKLRNEIQHLRSRNNELANRSEVEKRDKIIVLLNCRIKELNEKLLLLDAISVKRHNELKETTENMKKLAFAHNSLQEKFSDASSKHEEVMRETSKMREGHRIFSGEADSSHKLEIIKLKEDNNQLRQKLIQMLKKSQADEEKDSSLYLRQTNDDLDSAIRDKETENKILMEKNNKLKFELLGKMNECTKLGERLNAISEENAKMESIISGLKSNAENDKKQNASASTSDTGNTGNVNALLEKMSKIQGDNNAISAELMNKQQACEAMEKEMKLNQAIASKLRNETEMLKKAYVEELQNRRRAEGMSGINQELRSEILQLNRSLHEKDMEMNRLNNELMKARHELGSEKQAHDSNRLATSLETTRKERDEHRTISMQKAEEAENLRDHYAKLLELQNAETDQRIRESAKMAAERESEMRQIIEQLNSRIEAKNREIAKLTQQQKDFYLDLQRKIRQNILESGILKPEEESDNKNKNVLDFILKKNLGKAADQEPQQ